MPEESEQKFYSLAKAFGNFFFFRGVIMYHIYLSFGYLLFRYDRLGFRVLSSDSMMPDKETSSSLSSTPKQPQPHNVSSKQGNGSLKNIYLQFQDDYAPRPGHW